MGQREERKVREAEFHDQKWAEDTRARLRKYYSVVEGSREHYRRALLARCDGARVLEYGCGPGSHAFLLAETAREVVGIDISGVAIEQATTRAAEEGLRNVSFRVMDAEALDFADDGFDLVCGTAILHHLDLSRSYAEIARVLRPGGSGVFLEPLGHNPVINLYRRLTPRMRTVDEHPLLLSDFERARRHFEAVELRYFTLTALAALPFRRTPLFDPMVRALDRLDDAIWRLLPGARKYAWRCVLTLETADPDALHPAARAGAREAATVTAGAD